MKDIDNLFAELRTSEPYLADGGFTDVIMAQLPAKRELPFWLKNLILLGAATLGSVMVAMQLPTGGDLVSTLMSMASVPALDVKFLTAMAVHNLPIILIASLAIGYLMPYGAYLAVRRNAL